MSRWARVDRDLVDAAPWLPLYNAQSVQLLPQRVGGYRYNPIVGVLIDQLWVRWNRRLKRPADGPGGLQTTRSASTFCGYGAAEVEGRSSLGLIV